MEIILIRHGKVKYEYKSFYSSDGFNEAVKGYDYSDIGVPENHLASKKSEVLYVSGLRRTHDTADAILPGVEYIEDPVFNEVPVRAFANLPFSLPRKLWVVIGRGLWLLGSKNQPESRAETEARARRAVDILEAHSPLVILVSHGVFMRVLVKELKGRGYLVKGKVRYRNLDEVKLYKK